MKTFDLRQTIIPFSLLQIINHFKTMVPGEVVEIIYADESIVEDLECLLPESGYVLIEKEILDEDASEVKIALKKNTDTP